MGSNQDFKNHFDKNLTKLLTRGIVSVYIIYLAINVLISGFSCDQRPLLTIVSIIFLIAGTAFGIYAVREYIVSRRSNK